MIHRPHPERPPLHAHVRLRHPKRARLDHHERLPLAHRPLAHRPKGSVATLAHLVTLAHLAELGDLRVGETRAFRHTERLRVEFGRSNDPFGYFLNFCDLVHEPGINPGHSDHVRHASSGPERLVHGGQPAVVRGGAGAQQFRFIPGQIFPAERSVVALHRTQRLLQGFGERAADGHGLADGLSGW